MRIPVHFLIFFLFKYVCQTGWKGFGGLIDDQMNRLVRACCNPRVQNLAVVAADMLALPNQFRGFASSGWRPAGQPSDPTELLSAGRDLFAQVSARFVPTGWCCSRPTSFLTASGQILYSMIAIAGSPGWAERKTAKKQVQFWVKSSEKLPSGNCRRLA